MGDNESQVKVRIITTADPGGVKETRSQFGELFDDLKKGVADALSAGGADARFVADVVQQFDVLNQELQEPGASADEFAAKIASLQERLMASAAVEQKRIDQLKQGMLQALAEKDAEQDALDLSRRRREEDHLAAEMEAIAARRRIAALQEERELAKSVAQARQMSAEQRIERGVLGKGAYDPREDLERLKQIDAQTSRNIASMRGYKGSIGDAALAFAYMADDAQYGLRGIMNNIPQLTLMLGLGAGMTGAISLATIALNYLWEKFDGAKEAAKQTEEAKKRTEELTTAINAASQAASEMFKSSFDAYLAGLREATELWDRQKGHISEALAHQNELAKAEQAAAQAKLEIERQNKLAGAKSDEERSAINAEYDVRKAGVSDSGKAEAIQRAIEAQGLSINTLKARIDDVSQAKEAGQQKAGELNQANQGILGGIGQQSDQVRREAERSMIEARIKYDEQQMRERTARQAKRDPLEGGIAGEEYKAEQRKIEALQKSLSESYKQRDELGITKEADQEARKTGKGVTFDQAKKAATESGDTASMAKYTQAEQQLKDNAEAAAKAAEEALNADRKINELKIELTALEQKGVLLKKQQIAQQLEATAAEAKRAADAAAKNQKEDEAHLKKQREEEARKLENDAAELEKKGLYAGAASKRNDAAKAKLPEDATPEQKRTLDLENQKRFEEGQKKSRESEQKKEAQDIGQKAGNLGANLGDAGKQLKEAADKLRDGGTEVELEKLLAAFDKLAPTLLANDAANRKKYSEMRKRMDTLEKQLENGRTGSS